MKPVLPRITALLFITALLTACATAQTPAQKVYAIQSNYNAGLAVAVAYKRLPPCPAVPLCAKPSVVKDLQDADNAAKPSLDAAQAIVRNPGLGNVEASIVAANAAVASLTAITSTLKVSE